jgi:hypothetical protein
MSEIAICRAFNDQPNERVGQARRSSVYEVDHPFSPTGGIPAISFECLRRLPERLVAVGNFT